MQRLSRRSLPGGPSGSLAGRRFRRSETPDRVANPIDAFIVAKLEEKGLKQAPRADRLTLLRRAYFDLIGLPPTPEQVDRFLADSSPDAFAKVVDELLDSPRYGERWARHWLDVVRYADSAGYEGDVYYPNAWRFRDYVIKSLNDDKPYDRFVQEQIAGDELWPDDLDGRGLNSTPPEKLEHLEARVGTTMYTFGPEIQESNLDLTKLRYERMTDAADTTGAAFLGVTLGCARCHDHKFDPFPQKDYYSLQAIFAASEPERITVVDGNNASHRDEAYHFMIAMDEAQIAYRLMEKRVKDRVIESRKGEFSAAAMQAFEMPADKRSAEQAELAIPVTKAYQKLKIEDHLTAEERVEYDKLMKRLAKSVLDVPQSGPGSSKYDGFFDTPSATVLRDLPLERVPVTYALKRGDLSTPAAKVNAALPSALVDAQDPSTLPMGPGGPRFRKQLALWLTKPDHPLTARVMVNRIWQGHFGRGIVATANDFGRQGLPPSHPELLDWLATEFVRRGWSIKEMHRLIMLSNTYQSASKFVDAGNSKADPENQYLWRMNRRRLEAEAVWDSIHSAAGDLYLKVGGRPVMPPISASELSALRVLPEWVPPGDPREANRRGIYILIRRNFAFPLFDKFDAPDNSSSCPRRDETTVAPQALWTLNNQIPFREAERLAARLVRQAGDNPPDMGGRSLAHRPGTTPFGTGKGRSFSHDTEAGGGQSGQGGGVAAAGTFQAGCSARRSTHQVLSDCF